MVLRAGAQRPRLSADGEPSPLDEPGDSPLPLSGDFPPHRFAQLSPDGGRPERVESPCDKPGGSCPHFVLVAHHSSLPDCELLAAATVDYFCGNRRSGDTLVVRKEERLGLSLLARRSMVQHFPVRIGERLALLVSSMWIST